MITGLRGALEAISDDSLTVDIGPMSLEVFAPTSTIASVGPVGGSVRLHTYLYIREEILSLYGFGSVEERDLFVMLIGVSGVGPRLALSVLSTMSPRELAGAIGAEDTGSLTRVNGLGKKTAGRLILELKGQAGAGVGSGRRIAEARPRRGCSGPLGPGLRAGRGPGGAVRHEHRSRRPPGGEAQAGAPGVRVRVGA